MKIRCDRYFDEPAIWEEGGRAGNEGYCVIIADDTGEPKQVLEQQYFVCGRHGLFYIEEGDFVIKASYVKNADPPTVVEVYLVQDISRDEDSYSAELQLIAKWGKDLEGTIPSYLTYAMQAAEQKAMCPLCDHVHFGRQS
jgi:hypothetical protein